MIMQKMRRAGRAPPESKAGFYSVVRFGPVQGAGCLPLRHGLTVFRQPHCQTASPASRPVCARHCFVACFLYHVGADRDGTGVASIQASKPTQEIIMKLQFGQNQLVLELSNAPFAWFHGQTERMSLTSLSLLFVQFSLFARQPAV
jgi:hypothetical protein